MKKYWWVLVAAVLIIVGLVLNYYYGNMLSVGQFASGYFAAGQFATGVFAADTFAVGVFSIGILSFTFGECLLRKQELSGWWFRWWLIRWWVWYISQEKIKSSKHLVFSNKSDVDHFIFLKESSLLLSITSFNSSNIFLYLYLTPQLYISVIGSLSRMFP